MARAAVMLAGVAAVGGCVLLVAAGLRPYADNQRNWLTFVGISAVCSAGVLLLLARAGRRPRDDGDPGP